MERLPPIAQLRAFECAARHLSFKKAAEELAVTPTAISHHIRALEGYFGQPLFHRRPRPLRMTEAGARLFPRLRHGFDQIAAAVSGVGEAPAALAAPPFPADKPVVAVLPFVNLSGDADQNYFSDGLSEDIITLLSAWRSFPVVARHSSFVFSEAAGDVREIGERLAAAYIVTGSVRKDGERVRVSVQLLDAATGHHLWAERFDGALDNIFAIQDDLTRRIVSSVEPEMEKAERNRAATKRAVSLTAWDYYLRGRELMHRLVPDDNAEARRLFELAIAADPDYSDPHAGLSYTYQMDILLEVCADRAAWQARSLAIARRAVALDGASSIAHFALSGAYIWLDRHQESIAETRIAAALNPSNSHVWLALGNRLDIVGQGDEGIALLESSLARYPHHPLAHIYYGLLARAYINARNYDKGFEALQEAVRRQPDHPHTYHLLAICLGHMGRADEAHEAARRCDGLHAGFIAKRAYWNIYVDPAANAHLTDGLRAAGLVA